MDFYIACGGEFNFKYKKYLSLFIRVAILRLRIEVTRVLDQSLKPNSSSSVIVLFACSHLSSVLSLYKTTFISSVAER